MQNSDARIVRGLSIAVIALSALSLAGLLLGIVAVGMVGTFAADPSLYGDGISIDGYDHGHYDSLSPEATAGLVGVSLGIGIAVLVWLALCSAVSLVAGIIGLRNHGKSEKLGGLFGWTIAGAVTALLSGRFITMILLIVAAVYVNKLRNPAQPAYPQPSYYAPQPYPGQPGYGQPAQPGYPQAGAQAAQQPASYGQPCQPPAPQQSQPPEQQ